MDNEHAEGWFLESVATYLRADGWTFPMTENGGFDEDESMAHHLSNIDPDDEGAEWWQSLSETDEIIVNNYLANKVMQTYRVFDEPAYDVTRDELIATLSEPTLDLQGDTEDGIREWVSSNTNIGDTFLPDANGLWIERIS